MANLGRKNGIYHVRFRYQGAEHKRSLKTTDADLANIALKSVERTIGLLLLGQKTIPEDVDPGDFILSDGTVQKPKTKTRADRIPTLTSAINEYLNYQQGQIADTYLGSQRTHLKHLTQFFNGKAALSCNAIAVTQLDQFLRKRMQSRDSGTVTKERITLRQFFAWCEEDETRKGVRNLCCFNRKKVPDTFRATHLSRDPGKNAISPEGSIRPTGLFCA